MVNFSSFFLTFLSISAVLLSLCATLRTFAFSSLLRDETTDVQVGDQEYEEMLESSGKRALIAGIFFTATVLLSLGGFLIASFLNNHSVNLAVFILVLVFFTLGVVFSARSLTGGHMQVQLGVQTPKQDREPTRSLDEVNEEAETTQTVRASERNEK